MKSSFHVLGKILLWTTFLQILILTQTTPANATPEPMIKVEPYANFAQVGEPFTINISLTDVQNLYGVDVSLSWDASILQIVDADVRLGVERYSDGVLHETVNIYWSKINNTSGKYCLVASSQKPAPPFSGKGTIVRITFNATDTRGCKLDIEATLANSEIPSMPIPHTTIDGFFGRLINISVFPMMINTGENISIGGFIIPAQANVEVAVVYRHEGETDWHPLSTVRTNEQGNYLYVWQPQEAGKYEIKTNAVIEGTEETSSSVLVSVQAPEQPTWVYIIILIVIIITVVAAIVMYRKKSKGKKRGKFQEISPS